MRFGVVATAIFVALLALPQLDLGQAQGLERSEMIHVSRLVPLPSAEPKLVTRPDHSFGPGAMVIGPFLADRVFVPLGSSSLTVLVRPRLDTMPAMPDGTDPLVLVAPDVALANPGLPPQLGVRAVASKDARGNAAITGNALNLRAGPSSATASVGRLSRGQRVTVTGERRGLWVPIRVVEGGQSGWVFYKYVQRSG